MSDHLPRTRRALLRGGSALVATGLAGCVLSMEPYTAADDRSFDPGDADALAVLNRKGSVTLSGGDGDTVAGSVRKESRSGRDALDEVTVEPRTEDGTFVLETDYPENDPDVAVHFDLSVPGGLAVERAVTVNGDVDVSDVSGDATCRSRNGDVTAEGVDGFVTVESSNGTVRARETTGVAGGATSNGNVRVDVHALRDDVALASTNGNVTAAVPSDLSVAVVLETTNGDVSVTDLDLERETSGRTEIRGRVGEGDPEHELTLETTNGNVTLRSL